MPLSERKLRDSRRYVAKWRDDPGYRARRKAANAKYEAKKRLDPAWRAARVEIEKRRKQANPLHHAARVAVATATRSGRLIRPSVCSSCGGSPSRIEAHHEDYSKPLEVVWLCKSCHVAADAKLRGR